MATTVFAITQNEVLDGRVYLVRADSEDAALAHVARKLLTIATANRALIAEANGYGGSCVEDAVAKPAD
jgi:hypothetical protein